jgi:hypothetical protein
MSESGAPIAKIRDLPTNSPAAGLKTSDFRPKNLQFPAVGWSAELCRSNAGTVACSRKACLSAWSFVWKRLVEPFLQTSSNSGPQGN